MNKALTQMYKQPIIPAVRKLKDFEYVLTQDFEYIALLETHLAQLPSLVRRANEEGKKILLHADLVKGLKPDEAGAQYLAQVIRPTGLISTHIPVITTAKKNGLISVQRIFLLDSHSLRTSIRILTKAQPDCIEVLPGNMPDIISEIQRGTQVPILAGGFIRTPANVHAALAAGASAVTTSRRDLWENWIEFSHTNE